VALALPREAARATSVAVVFVLKLDRE